MPAMVYVGHVAQLLTMQSMVIIIIIIIIIIFINFFNNPNLLLITKLTIKSYLQ